LVAVWKSPHTGHRKRKTSVGPLARDVEPVGDQVPDRDLVSDAAQRGWICSVVMVGRAYGSRNSSMVSFTRSAETFWNSLVAALMRQAVAMLSIWRGKPLAYY